MASPTRQDRQRRRFRERVLHEVTLHPGSDTEGLALVFQAAPGNVKNALNILAQQGYIENFNGGWSPVSRSKRSLFRQQQPEPVLPPASAPTVASTAAADALADSFMGYVPGTSACLRAVQGDEVMVERIHAALAQGWQPADLVAVPRHRRPQVLEDNLNTWNEATRGGPCSICGSAQRRRGYLPRGLLAAKDEVPGWHVSNAGEVRCAHCQEYISMNGLDSMLEQVFRIFTGTVGQVWHRVPTAAESQRRGDGSPWSHVQPVNLRKIVLKDERYLDFATPAKPWRHISLPGFPRQHTWEQQPRERRTVPMPLTERDRALARQARDHQKELRERREADQKAWERRCAALAEADRRYAASDPETRSRLDHLAAIGVGR